MIEDQSYWFIVYDKIFTIQRYFISFERIVKIILDLKNGEHYIAHYGLDLMLIDHKDFEIIDLNDFNFKFEKIEDLQRVIRILQILDSDNYNLKNFDLCLKGFHFLMKNYDNLRKDKYLMRYEKEYIYIDPEDIEIYDRIPEYYPDLTERILNDSRIKNIL